MSDVVQEESISSEELTRIIIIIIILGATRVSPIPLKEREAAILQARQWCG